MGSALKGNNLLLLPLRVNPTPNEKGGKIIFISPQSTCLPIHLVLCIRGSLAVTELLLYLFGYKTGFLAL